MALYSTKLDKHCAGAGTVRAGILTADIGLSSRFISGEGHEARKPGPALCGNEGVET